MLETLTRHSVLYYLIERFFLSFSPPPPIVETLGLKPAGCGCCTRIRTRTRYTVSYPLKNSKKKPPEHFRILLILTTAAHDLNNERIIIIVVTSARNRQQAFLSVARC